MTRRRPPPLPPKPAPPPYCADERVFVGYGEPLLWVALLVAILAIAILFDNGCADPAAAVRPARVASNAAADALVIAQRLEVARIKQVATANMLACPADDVACRTGAVDAAFSSEQPRIAAINTAVKTQNDVAVALVSFDSCLTENSQPCMAAAIARIAPLAPELARLLEQVKGATP